MHTACTKPGTGPTSLTVPRCAVELESTGYFSREGSGANAQVIASEQQLVGGAGATGRLGDVLLQNDKIRVIIEQPGRTVGTIPSGGSIIDADIQRKPGETGRDAFGRLGLFYALGRYASIKQVEVLADGSTGGPAVVASTGVDVEHDLLNIQSLIERVAGFKINLAVDPTKAVPLRTTTYYVLSPGEQRVRMLTAFCNDGDKPVFAPLVELAEMGSPEIFNPGRCNQGLGMNKPNIKDDCAMAPSQWFGAQAEGVAYGFRSFGLEDLTQPVKANAVLGYGRIAGTFVEGKSLQGVLSWTDSTAKTRAGEFAIRAGQSRMYLRDFVVAEHLAAVQNSLYLTDHISTGSLAVHVQLPGGAAAAGTRVAISTADEGLQSVMVTDNEGLATTQLPPGTYSVSAAQEGRLPGPSNPVTITVGQQSESHIVLGEAHQLHLTVSDTSQLPIPGKVTVFCAEQHCPFDKQTYRQYAVLEQADFGAAAIGYVPVGGQLDVTLPPGKYEVVVSRGPEFSTWPESWPTAGFPVDLTAADAHVHATLGRIVDTTGWMSADLHVHAVSSNDSAIGNALRAANFLAEGVDVLVSTDHDVIADFAPTVRDLGAEHVIATMVGEEITTFSHGHFNAFPLTKDPSVPNGGAIDHAGGEAFPTLRMPELTALVKEKHPHAVVQLNHPRGSSGVFSLLRVDTDTLATHGAPEDFNMAADPTSSTENTKLLGDTFDAVESANGPLPSYAVLNDWMTLLSRGTVRTTTGVSDSHQAYSDNGGYSRTWVNTGADTPQRFDAVAFADALRRHQAFVSNGPLLHVTAQRLDSRGEPQGDVASMGDTLSVPAGQTMRLTVDVQGQEWMQIDRIELYSHAPGREAFDGEPNKEWPEGRILQKHDIDFANEAKEPVPGTSLRRLHLVRTFEVTPQRDTWFVVMVRGNAERTMKPLHVAPPIAYSNAILVDADGSGAYDDFPLRPGQPLRKPRPSLDTTPRALSPQEFSAAMLELFEHRHE